MRMNHYKLPAGVQDLLPEEYYNVSLLTEKLKNKFRLAGWWSWRKYSTFPRGWW